MDPELSKALTNLAIAVTTGLTAVIGAWATTKLPGPLRDLMTAAVHSKDIARLTEAMQRRAVATVADTTTPTPTPAEIIAYVERVRGDLLQKMQVQPEALETMAKAAIAQAEVAVSPPDVLLPPRA